MTMPARAWQRSEAAKPRRPPLLEAKESKALLRGKQREMASAVLFSRVLSIATLGAFIALA
jgi:hypothetical protein